MYLRGSKWSMNKRRTRPNWFRIILLSLLIIGLSYFNRYVVANVEPLGVPSPTPTRAPESFVAEAEDYFKQGKLIPAIDSYKKAVAAKPDDPAIRIALARVQVWAGQYKEAKTNAEDALLLSPDNAMAHAVRAWALDFLGEYLEAESQIKRALELDPNNALAHAYYVEILIDTGSFENIQKAIDESQVAVALAPDLLETRRARGYLLEATANYEEAIREYEAAVAINPNIADLHLALGRNYRALGIYDKAVEEFTRANALNPQDPTPDLFISRTYATIGEYAKAMQYAESAVTDNPTDASLRGNLGVMYYRNLYWAEAIVELEYVVKGGVTKDGQPVEPLNLAPNAPRIAEYYFTYGLALSRLNRCGEALLVAQDILARIPADELAVNNANEIISRCRQNLNTTPTPPPAQPNPDSTTPTATSAGALIPTSS